MESGFIIKKENNKQEIYETNRENTNYFSEDAKKSILNNLNHETLNVGQEQNINYAKEEEIVNTNLHPTILNLNENPLDLIEVEDFDIKLTRKNSNQIQKELLEMGFELFLINNLISNLEVQTTEQAIEYLSKVNGKWNHPILYMDQIKNNDNRGFENANDFNNVMLKCGICGGVEDDHYINTIENKRSRHIDEIDNKIFKRKFESHAFSENHEDDIFKIYKNFSIDIHNDNEDNLKKKREIFGLNFENENIEEFRKDNKIFERIYFGDININNNLQGLRNNERFNLSERIIKSKYTLDNPNNNTMEIAKKGVEESLMVELIEFTLKNEKKIEIKKEPEIKECEICLGELTNTYKLDCKHSFCRDCLEEYINNKINNSEIRNIPCPNGKDKCAYVFKDLIIDKLVNKLNMERYKKFKRRNELTKIKGVILCPIPDCESFAIIDKNLITQQYLDNMRNNYVFNTKIECELNFSQNFVAELKQKLLRDKISMCIEQNHSFCLKCKQASHIGRNCELGKEKEFNKFVGNDKHFVKKCPKCKFLIQKNQGCNHMTCANKECKYEFCWICLGKYSSKHFRIPFSPCFYMQNSGQDSFFVKHPWLIYPRLFLIWILLLIFISLIIICGPMILACMVAASVNGRRGISTYHFRNQTVAKISNLIFFMSYPFLGIGLYPIVFILLSIAPFVGLGVLLKKCS